MLPGVSQMREPTFLILTCLAGGARHGYGIIREVGDLSDGRYALLPGTLYTALDRLTAQGLIEPDREEVVDGRPRRYYRLTRSGADALRFEAARLRELAANAEARLAGPTPLPSPA